MHWKHGGVGGLPFIFCFHSEGGGDFYCFQDLQQLKWQTMDIIVMESPIGWLDNEH